MTTYDEFKSSMKKIQGKDIDVFNALNYLHEKLDQMGSMEAGITQREKQEILKRIKHLEGGSP